MARISVGDIMTRNFVSINPKATILECAKEIVKNRINNLPLVHEKKLVGIINARDILWAITKKPNLDLNKVRAADIAIKKVAVIKPSADIHQAMKKMRELNFRTLPVLSMGRIIGVITLKDILRIEPELYPKIGELAEIKEEERKIREANVEWPLEGFCDICGAFSNLLKVDSELLCPDCCEEMH